MQEIIDLKVKRYFTRDRQPTCCLDVFQAQVCIFLRTENFGQKDVCILQEQEIYRKDELGFAEPCKECIIHKQ